MDINSNRAGSRGVTTAASSKPKHISRLRKEMLQHRMYNHPFSSPPSTTGSHDTVSTTTEDVVSLSNFSFNPDEEVQAPARRQARSSRFASSSAARNNHPDDMLNTSVIARTFPEWSGLVSKEANNNNNNNNNNNKPSSSHTSATTASTEEPARSGSDRDRDRGKENVPPGSSGSVAGQSDANSIDKVLELRRRSMHASMQARAETETDVSSVLSNSPSRPPSSARRSRFVYTEPESPDLGKSKLQTIATKIRVERRDSSTPRRASSLREVLHHYPPPLETPAPPSSHQTDSATDQTGPSPMSQSFYLPAFRHLPDWTSGTLRFSTMKNGVPVFVRSSKSGGPNGIVRHSQAAHADLPGVGISPEDEQIFVSMDKLQEEVRELHDHDAMLQREAERLQREVNLLQAELKRYKGRKPSDSAIGSESDTSFRRSAGGSAGGGSGAVGVGPEYQALQAQIAELRERLEQTHRQVGVNDIHNTALVAERDEALRQAQMAREKAAKLQAELDASQKDRDASLQLMQDKEALELKNAELSVENAKLREQRDALAEKNKALMKENESLRRELSGIQKDLAAARDELASVCQKYEALQKEKRELSHENAMMERQNEDYYQQTKKLQAQVAARDQHIADLRKGIKTRDDMIDTMQGLNGDEAVLELNAELEAEVEELKKKVEMQTLKLQQREVDIDTKESKIRLLRQQNQDLAAENEKLVEEIHRLRAEQEDLHDHLLDQRQRMKEHRDSGKHVNGMVEHHIDYEDARKLDSREADRREAAVRKVKELTSRINEIAEREFLGGSKTPAKVARIISPRQERHDEIDPDHHHHHHHHHHLHHLHHQYDGGEKNGAYEEEDTLDRLAQLATRSHDDADAIEVEIAKLRKTYEELIAQQQRDNMYAVDMEESGRIRSAQQTPRAARGRSKSDSRTPRAQSRTPKGGKLTGILKKPSQSQFNDDDAARFSVKSAMSIVGHEDQDDPFSAGLDAASTPRRARRATASGVVSDSEGDNTPRPANRERVRRHSDASIIELNRQRTPGKMQQNRDVKQVLDSLCKHNSTNCNICLRIAAVPNAAISVPDGSKPAEPLLTAEDISRGKKTVTASKPIPPSALNNANSVITNTVPQTPNRPVPLPEDQPTIRPSMPPGEALAVLIKETRDEIDHLQMRLRSLNEKYFAMDKAVGMRERRKLMGDIQRLQAELEAKSGHLYRLYDVLEGQREAGQEMRRDEVEVTVLSWLGGVKAAEEEEEEEGGGGGGEEGKRGLGGS
ncbi:uncharacterized protein CTHT_0056550 [Thermochaetoides thermophila DSM 1495]|uniref:Cep57 centrosome microtubule-binding domain-containing protein n=1 Tax=Chaetomium thermophilum (strain DSM 1495 / CBS 144.50 / IMI 039719) TaxID=759272 RepID=G0SCA7_CHATD|nr:hypothetical protein CTHT_0056550 [Thermochaetoides thermophila DSM 1495]EGS19033.1 hypothetical protein CTHT_0056550 [Thermochaetoides thermophila DSM 1495]